METSSDQRKTQNISWVTSVVIASTILMLTVLGLGAFTAPPSDEAAINLDLQPEMSQVIRDTVRETLVQETGREIPKIQAIDVIGPIDGYVVQIRFAGSGDNLEETVQNIRTETLAIMENLFNSTAPIKTVSITATYEMPQAFGPSQETAILKCTLNQVNTEAISWNQIDGDTLFSLMDDIWWHTLVVN